MIAWQIFDSLLEPTFILNHEGKVIYCNEAASQICDVSVRKLMRSQPLFTDILKFNENIESLSSLSSLMEASPYQEVSFSAAESERRGRAQITAQPFKAENEVQYLVFFRDVTLEETLQRKYRAELEKKESVISDLEKAQAKLEEYSKNLEKMVAERTAQLSTINSQMTALLDSLGQAFLIFDKKGLCLEIASKACEHILETNPRGKKITDVLKLSEKSASSFGKWMTTAFDEMLPFEDLVPLAPNRFSHSLEKTVDVGYYPLRGADKKIEGIVLVATDISDLVAAQRTALEEKSHAQMIIQLVQNKKQVLGFLREADTLLSDLSKELSQAAPNHELSFRLLHTLKGGAASFSILDLAERTHEAEDALQAWSKDHSPEKLTLLRKSAMRTEESYQSFIKHNENILGSREAQQENWREISGRSLKNFYGSILDPETKKNFFREFMMETAAAQFHHFNDILQSTAVRTGKIVAPLELETPDFKFGSEAYQSLISTFVHALRNAVDHGIESPEVRESAGKNSHGHIRVWVGLDQGQLLFKIRDDGAGIDPAKIRSKSKSKGLDLDSLPDDKVIQQVFASEFSTKEEVTELSGRGVGMDAIMIEAKKLGGKAWVESTLGSGTALFIAVPWIESDGSVIQKAA